MDEVDAHGSLPFFDIDGHQRGHARRDERAVLYRPSPLSLDAAMDPDVALADPSHAYVDRVRALTHAAGRDTTVFQAVVVASLQTLSRVLERQRQAARASISLAQEEKMRRMVETTEAMIGALTNTLSKQGSKMLHLCTGAPARKGDPSWWFALTETIEAVEEGMERLAALVYGQPRGAPARTLSSLVVRLLHCQHNTLLAEAEQWIS